MMAPHYMTSAQGLLLWHLPAKYSATLTVSEYPLSLADLPSESSSTSSITLPSTVGAVTAACWAHLPSSPYTATGKAAAAGLTSSWLVCATEQGHVLGAQCNPSSLTIGAGVLTQSQAAVANLQNEHQTQQFDASSEDNSAGADGRSSHADDAGSAPSPVAAGPALAVIPAVLTSKVGAHV